jgi:hypothetical protein
MNELSLEACAHGEQIFCIDCWRPSSPETSMDDFLTALDMALRKSYILQRNECNKAVGTDGELFDLEDLEPIANEGGY